MRDKYRNIYMQSGYDPNQDQVTLAESPQQTSAFRKQFGTLKRTTVIILYYVGQITSTSHFLTIAVTYSRATASLLMHLSGTIVSGVHFFP